MALSANALTTASAVLEEVGAAVNGTHTARAERFIEEVSEFVASHCRRPFARATQTDKVRARGGPLLFLQRTPVIAVTSVEIDEVEVDADTYRIERVGGVDQALWRRTGWPSTAAFGAPATGTPIAGTEGASIVVDYEGGYVTPQQAVDGAFDGAPRTLPYDLEGVVLQLVTSRWRGKGQNVRERSRGYEASAISFGGEPVPPELLATLQRYTRVSHG